MDKKAKVLLISPNTIGVKDGINRIVPSLGLGYIAAVLLQNGHDVHVRDTALEGYENQQVLDDGTTVFIGETDEQIRNFVDALQPDIVGISVLFSGSSDSARNTARLVKEVNPNTIVVIGGNHITNLTKDFCYALSNKMNDSFYEMIFMRDVVNENIDYAMFGESDYEFSKLVNTLMSGGDINQVDNLVYRDGDNIVMTSEPVLKTAKRLCLEGLPAPAFQLFNMKKYIKIGAFQSPRTKAEIVYPIMATRGCPENCVFCTTPDTWGSGVRWRGVDDIRNEIKQGAEYLGRIDELQFSDDNLTADITRLYALCDELERTGIRWCTTNGTKANYHIGKQLEYYKRMKDAGCYQITIACETGNQNVMDEIIWKRLKLYEAAKAIENAKRAGLFVHTFWVVGLPGETRDEMEKTMMFAASVGADSYSVSIISPLPGTGVYRKAIEENLFWPDVSGIDNMTYRASLLKVDGFNDSGEFEQWVNRQNFMLNELLNKRNPKRFMKYEESRDPRFSGKNMRQT